MSTVMAATAKKNACDRICWAYSPSTSGLAASSTSITTTTRAADPIGPAEYSAPALALDAVARDALYDAAVVIGPSGHVGTFRKVHLPHPARPARHVHLLRRMVPRALWLCALQGAGIVCTHQLGAHPRPGQEPRGDGQHPLYGVRANSVFVAASTGSGGTRSAVRRPEPDRRLHRAAHRRVGQSPSEGINR